MTLQLLFDENLSHRLVSQLADLFPGSLHPESLGWRGRPEDDLWNLAKQRSLVIVSKDDDFRQRALLYGPPPKVVWLGVGNASTIAIVDLLRRNEARMESFVQDPLGGVLILELGPVAS